MIAYMTPTALVPIYLDHNATTPVLPEVVEAMCACYSELCFNPASQHAFGRRARRKLEDARERIAALLGADVSGPQPDRLVFTSGGTEANNLAVRGLIGGGDRQRTAEPLKLRGQIIISAVEHPSVTTVVDEMARVGWNVDILGVDSRGVIRADELAELIRPETHLVAAMLGQNETGVLQPVAELSAVCAEHNVPLHTDAAQVIGKLPVDFRGLGVSAMAVAAHKFHGPLGVGALLVRCGTDLRPQMFGGFQQGGLRPGTESVALAVGMHQALELWHAERYERAVRTRQLRDRFEGLILTGLPSAVVIGREAERLPHTSHIAFIGIDRQALFMALDQAGVACSTGSACASGSSEPSPVLLAMGCDKEVVTSALRFSLGATTTAQEVEQASRRIIHCCNNLRRQVPS
jgi:cysteine desulfurase